MIQPTLKKPIAAISFGGMLLLSRMILTVMKNKIRNRRNIELSKLWDVSLFRPPNESEHRAYQYIDIPMLRQKVLLVERKIRRTYEM